MNKSSKIIYSATFVPWIYQQGGLLIVEYVFARQILVLCDLCSSGDPYADVEKILARYRSESESEAQLKFLLPHILSCFNTNKSVIDIIKDLKSHESSRDAGGNLGSLHAYVCLLINLTPQTDTSITLMAHLVSKMEWNFEIHSHISGMIWNISFGTLYESPNVAMGRNGMKTFSIIPPPPHHKS